MSWKVYRSGQRGRSGLWNNPSFLNLWAAETVSQFGAQITLIALPLAAALSLDASASQMGILTAAGTLPFLVFGLFAGVWVDRLRRKPILIATDVGRAAILLAVPLAWSFDLLRVEMLYLVAFIAGLQTLFFDVAYLSFLPAIVRRDDLVDGNSKLQGSASVAQVAGPGIAGLLVGLITAPLAIVANVLTYLVSAFFIARITIDEPVSERHARPHVLREVGEGLRAVFGNAALRAIATSGGLVAIFGYLFLAVYVLYMTEELGFSAGQVGLVFSLGGVGAIIGSLLATPLQRRLGIGPTIVAGRFLFGAFGLLVPLAVGFPAIEVPMVLAAEFLQWLALVIASVNEISLRQTLAPDRLQGRVNATMRFVNAGLVPIGALAGGLLGELIGLRETLIVGIFGMLLAGVLVYFSPLRAMRAAPRRPDSTDELPTPATTTA